MADKGKVYVEMFVDTARDCEHPDCDARLTILDKFTHHLEGTPFSFDRQFCDQHSIEFRKLLEEEGYEVIDRKTNPEGRWL